jgi:hypothetical protein
MTAFTEVHRITASNVIREVETQRDLMIAVATGGPRIDTVSSDYANRRDLIQLRLKELGLEDPNPFRDLWEWYGRWSGGDLPSYRLRRSFLRDLFASLLADLAAIESGAGATANREPTGWPRVDRQLEKTKAQLARSSEEEDFQQIGLVARETLISLAQAVFDPSKHSSPDRVAPSDTDAGRMLESFIAAELAGGAQEEVRRHAKASLALALALQHKRTADFRMAALCTEATASVVNIIAITIGRRGPRPEENSDT